MWLEELAKQLTEKDKALKDITELYEKCSDEMRRLGKAVQEKNKQIEALQKANSAMIKELDERNDLGLNVVENLAKLKSQLEEKDKQIEELKKELEQWKTEWNDQVIKANEEGFARTQLQIKNKELEAQIEKMKMCCNCAKWNTDEWGEDNQPCKQHECDSKCSLWVLWE